MERSSNRLARSPPVPPWLALHPVIFITLSIGSRARIQPLWDA